jgi:hypothetical protein
MKVGRDKEIRLLMELQAWCGDDEAPNQNQPESS